MSIDGVSGKTSYIGTSIINMRAQLEALTTQLATGKASTTYAGQGIDRGFALSLRAQINTINSFSDTAKNVNTRLSVAHLALQGLSDINAQVKKASTTATLVLNNNGQTSGQITPRRRSQTRSRFSTASPATAICFPAAPLILPAIVLPT
jgi:hypothetical protein